MPTVFRDIVRSLLALAALTLICGIAYPVVVWGDRPGRVLGRANGSLVHAGGRVVGSSLLGQDWKGAQWFHGRALGRRLRRQRLGRLEPRPEQRRARDRR